MKILGLAFYGVLFGASLGPVALAGEVPSSAEDVTPLEVGASIPDVSVRSPDGSPVELRAAVSAKPTVLIFYRGGW